jgi:hypothetical protein
MLLIRGVSSALTLMRDFEIKRAITSKTEITKFDQ